jgi:hypothetical protein
MRAGNGIIEFLQVFYIITPLLIITRVEINPGRMAQIAFSQQMTEDNHLMVSPRSAPFNRNLAWHTDSVSDSEIAEHSPAVKGVEGVIGSRVNLTA